MRSANAQRQNLRAFKKRQKSKSVGGENLRNRRSEDCRLKQRRRNGAASRQRKMRKND